MEGLAALGHTERCGERRGQVSKEKEGAQGRTAAHDKLTTKRGCET